MLPVYRHLHVAVTRRTEAWETLKKNKKEGEGSVLLGNWTARCRKVQALGLWRVSVGRQPTKTSEEKCNVKFWCSFVQSYRCQSVALSSFIHFNCSLCNLAKKKKWPHLPDVVTSQPYCRLHNNIWRGGCVRRLLSPPPNSEPHRPACHKVRGSYPCQCTHVCDRWMLNTCMFTAVLRLWPCVVWRRTVW
jgi:hypothetical protein